MKSNVQPAFFRSKIHELEDDHHMPVRDDEVYQLNQELNRLRGLIPRYEA